MVSRIQHWINSFDHAAQSSDGNTLAQLLSFDYIHRNALDHELRMSPVLPQDYVMKSTQSEYAEIMASHLTTLKFLNEREYTKAYTSQAQGMMVFLKILQNETNWLLPALFKLCFNLRVVALNENKEMLKKGIQSDKLEDTARILLKGFSTTYDRQSPELTKRKGTLCVINHLFKVYFRINNIRRCVDLIKNVETPGFLPLKKFPVSHVVTYRFFVGRVEMFESRYDTALNHLTFAYEKCPPKFFRNKRLILLYLVPVNLSFGKFPSSKLLEKYKLGPLIPLCRSIKLGDLKSFNKSLKFHADWLIHKGIFLILEKLKLITYRNLFRKIVNTLNTTQVKLSYFVEILQWLGEDTDTAEVECILANLIYSRKIKGYISHSKSCLVVSVKDAFPKLSLK